VIVYKDAIFENAPECSHRKAPTDKFANVFGKARTVSNFTAPPTVD